MFNPDVLPFKRMSALDAVGDDYTLHVARTAPRRAAGRRHDRPRTRDRFWGDVLVQLQPGVDVPLPSVAPDMRILSYEVEAARSALTFAKDGADNFYVRSDESSASGTYRLVFLADADAGYFAPSLPPTPLHGRATSRSDAPPELRPVIPRDGAAAPRSVTLDKLGIDADMDLGVAFNKLVGYFRGFEASDITHPTGDIYRDLCDSQAGVCRHRSFAFMITANALGIPTRYVENEAHAFVEVWFPERGWQRIDLGGAALRMDVTGADNKTLHRPRARGSVREAARVQAELHAARGRHPRPVAAADRRQAQGRSTRRRRAARSSGERHRSARAAAAQTGSHHARSDAAAGHGRSEEADAALAVTSADASAYPRRRRSTSRATRGPAATASPITRVTIHLAPAGQDGRRLHLARDGDDRPRRRVQGRPRGARRRARDVRDCRDERRGRDYNAAKSDDDELPHGDGLSRPVAGGDCRAAKDPVRVRLERGVQVGKALLHARRQERRHHSGLQGILRAGLLSGCAAEGPEEAAGAARADAGSAGDEVHQRQGDRREGGDHQGLRARGRGGREGRTEGRDEAAQSFPCPRS